MEPIVSPCRVNDGELNSNVSTVAITVTSVNDLPVIAGSQQVEVNPPANGYFNVFSQTALTDVDDDGQAPPRCGVIIGEP